MKSDASHQEIDQSIAVIGLACRFPGAPDPAAFWELLRSAGSGIGQAPADRAATAGPAGVGGYLDAVDGFDAEFFGITPREAVAMDPQQRLMLELAWEALEQAGILPGALCGSRTGVFVGAISDDYATLTRRAVPAHAHTLTGLERGIIANRISYVLGLTGPSLLVDCAQSSGLVAVHMAARSLRYGEADLALAGGVNLVLAEDGTAAVREFGGLSPDGRCHTFDARANGYVRGEGGGLVLLKRLKDALADGDRVLGVIRGSAVTNDGATASLPTPGAKGQELALRAAYRDAAVDPATVQYVELHGSATRLGDPIEAEALGAVFAEGRAADRPLKVGSVKTNIGHLEGAAGIAGFIKTLLCIAHGSLVPSLNYDTANPRIPLDELRLAVQRDTAPWPDADRPLVAGVSSFGMGGTNCHVVLSDLSYLSVPPAAPRSEPEPLLHLAEGDALPWVVSARTDIALRHQAARLQNGLADADLVAAARTLAERRTAFEHRAVVFAADRDQLSAELTLLAEGRPSANIAQGQAAEDGRAVFVFPGQGSQWSGMGVRLLERSPVFARRFAECAKALAAYVDWNPEDVLRGVPGAPPPDRVDIVQPLLWSVMVSLAEVWLAAGVRPAAVVGHSQGELAAATVIGAVSLENAARIVVRRSAALLRHAGRGGMISVLLPEEQVRADIAPWEPELGILAVNGPGQAIVGGELAALDELVAHYAKREISTRRVEVDVVSHCAAVEVFRDELLADWAGVTPRAARIPFYSTVTGGELEPTELTGEYWYRNLRQEVRFGATVRELLNRGHRAFIEISPHPVLSTGVTQNADACDVPATVVGSLRRAQDDVRSLLGAFGEAFANGVPVHWGRVLGPGGHVDLPTYPFQRRRYWIDEPAHRERPVPAPESQEPVTPLGERLAGLSDAAAAQLVRNVVREHVAVVMGHQGMDAVRPRLKFKELGFDSSMIVSLRNRLAAATGLALPVDALYAHPSPAELAEHVARQVREQTAAARPEPVPVPVPAPPPAADDLARAVESASVQELFALIDGFENRGIDA